MTSFVPSVVQNSSALVFVLEPDIQILNKISEILNPDYVVQTFERVSSLLQAMSHVRQPDLTVMACSSLRQSLFMVKQVVAASSGSRVLLLSAEESAEDIARAMQLGATGFLRKPFRSEMFREAVQLQLDPQPVETASAWLRQAADAMADNETLQLADGSFFVRSSGSVGELEAHAALVALSDLPVLILGESGTGKEVLAKYMHFMSERKDKMFLKVNCAAMPAGLLESELFGHEKGAFTGAMSSNPGKFEVCNGGTMFLDEIAEMDAVLQAKLLHILQDGQYSRLGSHAIMRANVRVIAATNVNIKSAIASKKFREDLYYRINGFSVTLPPLRKRQEEIAIFARHFMKKAARRLGRKPLKLSDTLVWAFNSYSWPGNLRELESVINRYLVLGDERPILAALASDELALREPDRPADKSSAGLQQQMRSLLGSAESAAIASALHETRWNRRAAARKMNISYTSLRYKIKQYDLERPNPLTTSE